MQYFPFSFFNKQLLLPNPPVTFERQRERDHPWERPTFSRSTFIKTRFLPLHLPFPDSPSSDLPNRSSLSCPRRYSNLSDFNTFFFGLSSKSFLLREFLRDAHFVIAMLQLIPAVKIASWCLAAFSSLYNCFLVSSDRSADLPLTGFLAAFSNPNFFFVRII